MIRVKYMRRGAKGVEVLEEEMKYGRRGEFGLSDPYKAVQAVPSVHRTSTKLTKVKLSYQGNLVERRISFGVDKTAEEEELRRGLTVWHGLESKQHLWEDARCLTHLEKLIGRIQI